MPFPHLSASVNQLLRVLRRKRHKQGMGRGALAATLAYYNREESVDGQWSSPVAHRFRRRPVTGRRPEGRFVRSQSAARLQQATIQPKDLLQSLGALRHVASLLASSLHPSGSRCPHRSFKRQPVFSVFKADRWIAPNGVKEILQLHELRCSLGAMLGRSPQCWTLPQIGRDGRSLASQNLRKAVD